MALSSSWSHSILQASLEQLALGGLVQCGVRGDDGHKFLFFHLFSSLKEKDFDLPQRMQVLHLKKYVIYKLISTSRNCLLKLLGGLAQLEPDELSWNSSTLPGLSWTKSGLSPSWPPPLPPLPPPMNPKLLSFRLKVVKCPIHIDTDSFRSSSPPMSPDRHSAL